MNRPRLRHPECTPKRRSWWTVLPGLAQGRVEAVEQRHAVGEHVLIVLENGEQAADGEVHAARLVTMELLVAQVDLVDDLRQLGEPGITQAALLDERLERAVLALMPELGGEGVERGGARVVLLQGGETERDRGAGK